MEPVPRFEFNGTAVSLAAVRKPPRPRPPARPQPAAAAAPAFEASVFM